MKFVVAIDSFKGSLSSVELNQAAVGAIHEVLPEAEVLSFPIADGGEGTLESLAAGLVGEWIAVETVDLLERPLVASYYLVEDVAYIEVARVLGLDLIDPSPTTVEKATSIGLATLIRDALARSCRHLVLTLGGTGTSDGGRGLLSGLSAQDRELLATVQLTGLTDVTNPYAGPTGFAPVFGPQKGASPEQIQVMDKKAWDWVEQVKREQGIDLQAIPGTGAAGGLGGALVFLGGHLQPGFAYLAQVLGLPEALEGADLLVTGEGRMDSQSLAGKLPVALAQLGQAYGVPTLALCGSVDPVSAFDDFFLGVYSIQPAHLRLEQAMDPERTRENLRFLLKSLVRTRYTLHSSKSEQR